MHRPASDRQPGSAPTAPAAFGGVQSLAVTPSTAPTSSSVRDLSLIRTPSVRLGWFDAQPTDTDFATAGQARMPLVVFPLAPVWIRHAGKRPFVADPTVVTYHRPGGRYSRLRLGASGDQCLYVGARTACCPASDVHQACPIGSFRGVATSANLVAVHALARYVANRRAEEIDRAAIDRVCAAVLAGHTPHPCGSESAHAVPPARVALSETVKALLALTFWRTARLADLLPALGHSPDYIRRVFRHDTGRTLHQHREMLRLHSAVPILFRSEADLTDLALGLGFSSHSHFTARFRRHFGISPSAMRAMRHASLANVLSYRKHHAGTPPARSGRNPDSGPRSSPLG